MVLTLARVPASRPSIFCLAETSSDPEAEGSTSVAASGSLDSDPSESSSSLFHFLPPLARLGNQSAYHIFSKHVQFLLPRSIGLHTSFTFNSRLALLRLWFSLFLHFEVSNRSPTEAQSHLYSCPSLRFQFPKPGQRLLR